MGAHGSFFFFFLIQLGNPQKTTTKNQKYKQGTTNIDTAGHTRENPHLPICACIIGDLELQMEVSDAAWREKQKIYFRHG